jgi:UDP-N-acetylmuramoyl-tripeptide--D-alanyl-D-alanine ligase
MKSWRTNRRRNVFRWFRNISLHMAATLWRPFLFRTTFIGITGSVGKTTTKECLAAILGSHYLIAKTLNNQNDWNGVPLTILRVRPWHRFAIVEMGGSAPGMMRRSTRIVRPHIAIVLAIARSHMDAYSTLDDIAADKAEILGTLSSRGIAILNRDDPRVSKMAHRCAGLVQTFGTTPDCDLWADQISSQWPERLSLRASTQTQSVLVKTNLVGEHWTNSVLAAILAAQSCGIELTKGAAALQNVMPLMARMQPVSLPVGATVLRDDMSGSAVSWMAALKVFRESNAPRKILVISDLSDMRERPQVRFRELGKIAAKTADLAIFVGEHGHHGVKSALASGMLSNAVFSFMNLERTSLYLRSELKHGDLVFLKGRISHHLARLFLAQLGEIGCWKTKCSRTILCDLCPALQPRFDLETTIQIPSEPDRTIGSRVFLT